MATNIITARFGGALSTRTVSNYQYNYGQILQFEDIDLPDVYEVHFSNREFSGDAIKQLGNADGVPIPDELFWSDTARAIYAWVYLHHAEDDGETVYKVTIPLAQRSRPSDVEPTPVQQDVIEQAIAALNSAMDETAASAAEAAEGATKAETARQAAEAAADGVEQYATRAETAAGQAEDAAGRAETAAQTVESRVADAETAATHAAGSATTASGAASQAAQKAGEASTYATNAGASASQAQTYASNAEQSATAASGSASAAADSATAAAGYAGAASGSATAAERSADNAASSAEAAHTSETNAAGSATEAAASAEAAEQSAEDAAQAVQTMRTTTAAIIIDSASGAVVSVPDGADDLPMQSVKVSIEPKQEGSGDPSPDNVRPISGWDAVTVTVNGTTYTTDLPVTVYGGTLDVVTGELVVDRAMVDLGTRSWSALGGHGVFATVINDIYKRERNTPNNAICSAFVGQNEWLASNLTNGSFMIRGDTKTVYFRNNAYTDTGAFAESVSNVIFVYALENPQTYHLTPQEIRTLLGSNTVMSEAGSVEITYPCDTKKFIVKMVS